MSPRPDLGKHGQSASRQREQDAVRAVPLGQDEEVHRLGFRGAPDHVQPRERQGPPDGSDDEDGQRDPSAGSKPSRPAQRQQAEAQATNNERQCFQERVDAFRIPRNHEQEGEQDDSQ